MPDKRGGNGPFDFEPPRMPQFNLPNMSPGAIRGILVLVVGLVLVFGSFYQIDPDEVGVVRRFRCLFANHRSRPTLQIAVHREA